MSNDKRMYYWVHSPVELGVGNVYGKRDTMEQAKLFASSISEPTEITTLYTPNEVKATRMIRAKVLVEGHDIDRALVRFHHNHM
jgi:hypothetical protein